MPLPLTLLVLFVLGACLGALANAISGLCGERIRRYSPWLALEKKAPDRKASDRIPLFGWFGLARESDVHGAGHWVRPFCVELGMAIALPALYYWEIVAHGLYFEGARFPIFLPGWETPSLWVLHWQYAAHVVLLTFLLTGSLIDLDDRIIPDIITVPGTLLALLFAVLVPMSMLPVADPNAADAWLDEFIARQGVVENDMLPTSYLSASSSKTWPASLDGAPRFGSLALAIACWLGWCAALAPRTWYARHGVATALKLMLARMFHRSVRTLWAMAVLGVVGISCAWFFVGDTDHWRGLLTALVGMVGAGGMIWAVRIIGQHTLLKEAMGFGDVTLMAMIGAFLGWQTSLVIFFLAPLAGVVLGILLVVLKRDTSMPYGPFLAIATGVAVVFWVRFWVWTEPAYDFPLDAPFPWLVPAAFAVCMVLMAVMLTGWRYISGIGQGDEYE